MFFFFKKPKVKLNCFLPQEYSFVKEYAPIGQASNFIPSWYKDLPTHTRKAYLSRHPSDLYWNAKSCPGINNIITKGYIIPNWCDIRIDWSEGGYAYNFSDQISQITDHGADQVKGLADNYHILKIESPWLITSSKPLSFTYFPLTYHQGFNSPIKTIHGIQETKTRYNAMHAKQFFFLEKCKNHQRHLIQFGTPLVHFMLPEDNNYKLEIIVDGKEHYKISNILNRPITFFSKHRKMRLMDKKNKEEIN